MATDSESRAASLAEEARARHLAKANVPPMEVNNVTETSTAESDTSSPSDETDKTERGTVRATTTPDPMRRRIAELESQLAAANGRVAPMQQDLAAARLAVEEANRLRAYQDAAYEQELKDLREAVEAKAAEVFNPMDLLTEEERDMVDDQVLNLTAKLTSGIFDKKMKELKDEQKKEFAKYQAQQTERERSDYFRYVVNDQSRGLATLQQHHETSEFNDWVKSEDGQVFEHLFRTLASAPKQDMDRLAKLAAKEYRKFENIVKKASGDADKPQADISSRLAAHAERTPSRVAPDRARDLSARVQRLSASRDPKDREQAKKLLDELRKL